MRRAAVLRFAATALVVVGLVGELGCKKEPRPTEGATVAAKDEAKAVSPLPKAAPEKKQEAFHQPIVEALKKAGLTATDFETTAAKPYKAEACARGEVDKFDVMICLYASEENAKAAEPDLTQFIEGAVTGAIRRSGLYMLTIADRKKLDLGGKGLSKVLVAFTKSGSGS